MDIPTWQGVLVATLLFNPELQMIPIQRQILMPILWFSPETWMGQMPRLILMLIPLVNRTREMLTQALRVWFHRAILDLMALCPRRIMPTLLQQILMGQSQHNGCLTSHGRVTVHWRTMEGGSILLSGL